MAHVFDVARYILSRGGSMPAMKLQKLTYYSQAWHLVLDGVPLFAEPIEAWANGPVIRALYEAHRGQFTVTEETFAAQGMLSESEQSTIDAVLDSYGDLSASDLSDLTHSERPWLLARRGVPELVRSRNVIDSTVMLEFYQRQLDEDDASGDLPLGHTG